MTPEEARAHFIAGVVGCVIAVITFWVLSTLFTAGWAVVAGFLMGSAFSWTTYWTIIHRTSARRDS